MVYKPDQLFDEEGVQRKLRINGYSIELFKIYVLVAGVVSFYLAKNIESVD